MEEEYVPRKRCSTGGCLNRIQAEGKCLSCFYEAKAIERKSVVNAVDFPVDTRIIEQPTNATCVEGFSNSLEN
jgi:hypothetical protein